MKYKVLVVDNGCGFTKVGLAGDSQPVCVIPTIVGLPKFPHHLYYERDHYVGNLAQAMNGMLEIRHPIQRNVPTDWELLQKVWHHSFYNLMRQSPEECPILFAEPPLNPKANRDQVIKLAFEEIVCVALLVEVDAVLSLYASGRTTGVVLDSGDGTTNIVPIYEGHVIPHAIVALSLGGRDVTDYLMKTLNQHRTVFHATFADYEVCRGIKEKLCYVALEFDEEKGRDLSELLELLDGSSLRIGYERILCPEIMFQPSLIGKSHSDNLPNLLLTSIMNCNANLRETLFTNVVLAGGNTMFPGFEERLTRELTRITTNKIAIIAPSDRKYSAWIGGSILASLPAYQFSYTNNNSSRWFSRQVYDESGPPPARLGRHV
jgi:actin-related protein